MDKCSGVTPYSDVSADLIKECSSKSTRRSLLTFNIVLIVFVVAAILVVVLIDFLAYKDSSLDETDEEVEANKKLRNESIIKHISVVLILAVIIGITVNIFIPILNLKERWKTSQADIKKCMNATKKSRKACAYDVEQRDLTRRRRTLLLAS